MEKRKGIRSVILLSLLIIGIFSNPNFYNGLLENQTTNDQLNNINLNSVQEQNSTIEWGDNVIQNLPYNYSSVFYESTDNTFAFTNAKLETMYIPDNSVYYNDTITDSLENSESQYPTNESVVMVDGTLYQNGTFNELDDDDHIFNATDGGDLVPTEDNITLTTGYSNYEGDFTSIDGNFTMFNSTTGDPGLYNATYTFTDDTPGGDPAGWTVTEIGGTVNIDGIQDGHTMVVQIHDTGSGTPRMYNTFTGQSYGTFEYWIMSNDVTQDTSYLRLEDGGYGGTQVTRLRFYQGNIDYYNGTAYDPIVPVSINTWYHIRIDFECTTGLYMGLAQYTFDLYMDKVLIGDGLSFWNTAPTIDTFTALASYTPGGFDTWWDAIGYSWDPYYDIGDNYEPLYLPKVNFTVDINLNSFASLDDLYLVSAYRTNTTYQLTNFSIYNFDNSEYDLISSAVNLTFQNSIFLINSSYYNATNYMLLKFELVNDTTYFRLEVDRLLVRHPSYLNFTTYINFSKLTNSLQLDIESYQMSSFAQAINISAWNWTSGSYINLGETSHTGTIQLADFSDYTTYSDYIDSNGKVLVSYYGTNKTDRFDFYLDMLNFTLWRKTVLTYEKTLTLLGTWKYRFHLDVGLPTAFDTSWVYFNVVIQTPNFEGISESRYSTRWVLTSTATTGTLNLVYEDDLTSALWHMDDYSDQYVSERQNFLEDAYVDADHASTNYGQSTNLYVRTESGSEKMRTYLYDLTSVSGDYLTTNITTKNDEIYFAGPGGWGSGASPPFDLYLYTTTAFDEDAITWNNKYAPITLKSTKAWSGGGVTFDTGTRLGETLPYVVIGEIVSSGYYYINPYSYEYQTDYVYLTNYYPKFYHDLSGEGYAYIQSDETETRGLESYHYSSNYSLSAGDIFTVDLETTSSNAQLKLYSGGVLQTTLSVLVANTETSRQEVEVYVPSSVSFDQVMLTSEIDDTEYLKLYDIKAEHWTFSSSNDQSTMYVEPFGQNELIINSLGNASLKIYEKGILKTNTYVTIGYNLLTYVYESPLPQDIHVTLYDSNNDYLNFNDFKVYVNYTLSETSYTDVRLSAPDFYVDEDTYMSILIYDSFDTLVDTEDPTSNILAKSFVDIVLSVYTLKIKNEALDDASYTLTKISVSKSGLLFPDDIDTYKISSGAYNFSYIKGTDPEKTMAINLTSNKLLKINRSQMCFLSFVNQRGEHLAFEQFKTYWNGTLLYENVFYDDIDNNVSLEIKDLFDISIKNQSFICSAGDNYIPVVITMYSLKIKNMQELFNHINITRDPVYYTSSYSWSEWIAPGEIISFFLFPGYYKINLTTNEWSGTMYYSYTLAGDDILLISSNNTIANAIYNIQNVNTTLGNQITSVEINITNQNTAINNSIINVDINLTNVNSTLGNLLLNLETSITNVENNISTMFVYLNNNFTSISNLINTSFIDINTSVYLINNSIYTAVTALETNLFLINNSISGNMSIIIAQNDFLTALYQSTMFSPLLNWTGAGYNSSFITSQIGTWDFINNYRDRSVQVFLRYNSLIDNITVAAQNTLEQNLPSSGVEYRLYSVANDEYLNQWTDLPENRTVDFGFFEADIPPNPEEYIQGYEVIFAITMFLMLGVIVLVGFIARSRKKGQQPSTTRQNKNEVKVYKKNYAFNNQLDLNAMEKYERRNKR